MSEKSPHPGHWAEQKCKWQKHKNKPSVYCVTPEYRDNLLGRAPHITTTRFVFACVRVQSVCVTKRIEQGNKTKQNNCVGDLTTYWEQWKWHFFFAVRKKHFWECLSFHDKLNSIRDQVAVCSYWREISVTWDPLDTIFDTLHENPNPRFGDRCGKCRGKTKLLNWYCRWHLKPDETQGGVQGRYLTWQQRETESRVYCGSEVQDEAQWCMLVTRFGKKLLIDKALCVTCPPQHWLHCDQEHELRFQQELIWTPGVNFPGWKSAVPVVKRRNWCKPQRLCLTRQKWGTNKLLHKPERLQCREITGQRLKHWTGLLKPGTEVHDSEPQPRLVIPDVWRSCWKQELMWTRLIPVVTQHWSGQHGQAMPHL